MFTVPEVADLLGLSKQGLYKKIKKMETELKQFTYYENGTMKVTQEGVNLLKSKSTVNEGQSKLYRDKYIISLQNQVNQLTKALEDEKQEKSQIYMLLLQEKQEKQLLLESAAAKEKRGFFAKLFGR